jgi:membrane protein YqaA with SNARE-associated domain
MDTSGILFDMDSLAKPHISYLRRLYNWVIEQSSHPKAMWILNIVSFAESSFFPLPPDLMIIPMVLAERSKAWMVALTCTISSIVGGWVGYAIGFYVYESIGEWLIDV